MNFKASFIAATLLTGQVLAEGSAAPSQSLSAEDTSFSLMPQFHIGLSGGITTMTGRRSEQVLTGNTPPLVTFSDRLHFLNKNAHYFLFAGCRWNLSKAPVFFGPEIHLGHAHTETTRTESMSDVNNPELSRTMRSAIRASTSFGAAIQTGFRLPHQSQVYLLVGGEVSKFQNDIFYIPRSRVALFFLGGGGGALPTELPPSYFSAKKWLPGLLWGVGLEKEWNSLRIGGEVRLITYRKLRVSRRTESGSDDHPYDTISNIFKLKNTRVSLRVSYRF